jgi:uroporphyrinogen decarboxylase
MSKTHYPEIPKTISTPSSSLYVPCWNSIKTGRLPGGIAVLGGGLYHPSQGFALDYDVRNYLKMDPGQILVDVNMLFCPMFELNIIEENESYLKYLDVDGVTRLFSKETAVIPVSIDYPIKDWETWNILKAERLRIDTIEDRFPDNWDELLKLYRSDDVIVTIGGYPHGYFGTLAHLMGYEQMFVNYYYEPELIHDIQKTFTDLWIEIYTEIISQVDVDLCVIWEDMSAGTGSMVSPNTIREFMSPYYKRLTEFLKHNGIKTIFIDTDGYCFDIIPIFIEAGITGMYPIEVSCGMDLVKVRKAFPELRLMGGIPKSEIQLGKQRIDQILEPVAEVVKSGGYVPFGDHLIPPSVNWDNFKYYREKLNRIIDNCGVD